MNVLFDMETGDPDDLITLILLLVNPDVQLRGITCYQGSPIQIGLIHHVLKLADKDIPVGGWNCEEPSELSPYYTEVVGQWKNAQASMNPVEVFQQVFAEYPNTHVLTGAPLTNLGIVLDTLPNIQIKDMVTQGGFLGDVLPPELKLKKFKNKNSFRTYNLGNDLDAFTKVNFSTNIEKLTYVTKDLCHGFLYTPEIHKNVSFGESPIQQLLKKCLEKYALAEKSKAMHDPLAMLVMIYPYLGQKVNISMNYNIDERGHPVFSSIQSTNHTMGLVTYQKDETWQKFINLCEYPLDVKVKNKIK